MEFAKRLKELREKAGLSQKEVAEKCDLTPQAYNNYEKRGYSPTPELLVKFAMALNTTPNELLCFKEKKISDIDYAYELLDGIAINEKYISYDTVIPSGKKDYPFVQLKIPKKEFLEIVKFCRKFTENIIEIENDATRLALFREFVEREITSEYYYKKQQE